MTYDAKLFLCMLCTINAAKLRSWFGPASYFEGDLPSSRYAHGFAPTKDGRIYVFGGVGGNGACTQCACLEHLSNLFTRK